MLGITAEKIWGVVRTIAAAGAGYLIAKGYVDEATANDVLTGIGVVFIAVWSWASKPAAK
jgi:hypothetical protein